MELEDEVLANAGVDVFEEVFKLIFTKLYDEFESRSDKEHINRILRRQINIVIQESPESYGSRGADYETIKNVVETIPDDGMERPMEFRNTTQIISNRNMMKSSTPSKITQAVRIHWKI